MQGLDSIIDPLLNSGKPDAATVDAVLEALPTIAPGTAADTTGSGLNPSTNTRQSAAVKGKGVSPHAKAMRSSPRQHRKALSKTAGVGMLSPSDGKPVGRATVQRSPVQRDQTSVSATRASHLRVDVDSDGDEEFDEENDIDQDDQDHDSEQNEEMAEADELDALIAEVESRKIHFDRQFGPSRKGKKASDPDAKAAALDDIRGLESDIHRIRLKQQQRRLAGRRSASEAYPGLHSAVIRVLLQ